MNRQGQGSAGASLANHLHGGNIDWPRKLKASVLFGKAHACEALLEHFGNVLAWKLSVHVDLSRSRLDLFLDKIPERV